MTANAGIEITADKVRNLICICFHGRVTAAAMKARVVDVEEFVGGLRLGFTVLTDLSDLEAMEVDCVESLTRMMDVFKIRGVDTVVRVIPDPAKDIGFNILSLTHYRGGVKVITCETMAEAQHVLPTGSSCNPTT
jgi:hypothetical protein